MSILMVIKNTPAWVWVLFVFLVLRGIKALDDREMHPSRLFLLPILFFIWAVYSVLHETVFQVSALLALIVGILAGIAIGWKLWNSQPRLRQKPESDLIIRQGTPLTLILILIIFCVKFVLSATIAIHPILMHSLSFNLLFGFASGLSDGIFWGGTLNLFVPYYKDKQKSV
ncbi:conserved membrane hypothetical protein [Xenorhabdus cabanillasii JM26]|uniref:DUF1453 domain-containing protein n=3 Tax=Xenorhabdus cabanillasii TaxID=351673 RepID=A0A3D9UG11_9GAMM|nr:DUF6622 family protein [Xenorhabdus cabanillasii]PHM76347.1 membrane protein [Xenorhabdus cabanillasii JM26]REF28408.1 hypothetical protein BDD26_3308 [Xenorhabdus cabanillasii]CDL87453.1 conserved membrane hypothetical protein [Xenorhabdus cabanillasii JM26]